MNWLAFDTSTAACSVALRRSDGAEFAVHPPAARMFEQPAHTTELLPAILALLDEADLRLDEISRLVVGVGPGAFTGLRIGMATARAIATANEIGLVPISSLAALAANEMGTVPVIDARRREFFFRIDGVDLLAGPEDAATAIAEAEPAQAIGDGAVKLRDLLEAAGVNVPDGNQPVHVISAISLLDRAASVDPVDPDEVVPNYIRPPDAKVSSRESWLVAGR
jgi:tRNA threonylcarbamoyladenosine biosynthesis protein TsaB